MLRSTDGEMVMPLLLMGKAAPLPRLPRFSTGMPSLLRTSSLLHQSRNQLIVTGGEWEEGGGKVRQSDQVDCVMRQTR